MIEEWILLGCAALNPTYNSKTRCSLGFQDSKAKEDL
jgi:hypothetical protein